MFKPGWRFFLSSWVVILYCVSVGFGGEKGLERLFSKELLAHSKMEKVWEVKVPIRENENLKELVLVDNRIYAISNLNYVVSLNRNTGSVIFSSEIAPAGFPVLGLGHYDDELFSIIGNSIIELNPDSGAEISSERLAVRATCPAARNRSNFYVAGIDRRVHCLRVEDKVQLFEAAAKNDSIITSIVAEDSFVIFSTDAGNLVRISPDEPRFRWEFEASGGIVGPIIKDGDSLFIASEDTNVYKVNIIRGKLDWKYQTNAVLDEAPRVTEEAVYQYAHHKGLASIDTGSGEGMWELVEGVDLLAERSGNAYVITKEPKLIVMDNKAGKQLYSVNLEGVTKYVSNVVDSKIYIGDDSGRIACIRPVE